MRKNLLKLFSILSIIMVLLTLPGIGESNDFNSQGNLFAFWALTGSLYYVLYFIQDKMMLDNLKTYILLSAYLLVFGIIYLHWGNNIIYYFSLLLYPVVIYLEFEKSTRHYIMVALFSLFIIALQSIENQSMGKILTEPVFFNFLVVSAIFPFIESSMKNFKKTTGKIDSRKIEELNIEIAKLKRKNKKLKKTKKTQQTLLAMISHDMKSPLSSLMGLVSLVRKNLDAGINLKSIIEQLDNRIKNTTQNVDNILEWSKTLHNGIVITPKQFRVNESMELALQFVHDCYSDKKINTTYDSKNTISAYGDENVFQVVLRNILSNAFKFSKGGGIVDVAVNAIENNLIQIQIRDYGIGMSEKNIQRIFKGGNSTHGTNGEKGTGLGLMISKRFIEGNNGTISVESKENVGTMFTFTIPAKPQLDENGLVKKMTSKIFISL